MYGITTRTGYLKASQIVAMLDANISLQNAHIQAIRNLEANGMRYSNEDCDVLGAALSVIGKSEVAEYNRKWVEAMNDQAAKMRGAA